MAVPLVATLNDHAGQYWKIHVRVYVHVCYIHIYSRTSSIWTQTVLSVLISGVINMQGVWDTKWVDSAHTHMYTYIMYIVYTCTCACTCIIEVSLFLGGLDKRLQWMCNIFTYTLYIYVHVHVHGCVGRVG